MNVAGSGRVGSSFSIRVAHNNVLGWRWTVEKEHFRALSVLHS